MDLEDKNNKKTDFTFPEDYNYEENLIELTPENELKFVEGAHLNSQIHSGSSSLSQATFIVKNVFDGPVLFKIQTTSPLHYRVKPSHGRIEAGESNEVRITMSSDSKKSDKFLINVVPTFIEEESSLDFNGQYNLVPENFIQKYRLRCVTSGNGLLAATSTNNLNLNNNGSGSVGSISSPVAPSLLSQKGAADSMTSVTSALEDKASSVVKSVNYSPSLSSSATSTKNELKEARAEIERLKSLKINDNTSAVAKEWKNVLSAQYGVPPVLVLLVAIFAFMVGLLF